MNKKKIITIGLVLALTISAVGCTKKTTTPEPNKNTEISQEYSNYYGSGYKDYIAGLEQYSLYSNPADITKIYENKEYPGNEKYLSDLKVAYKDSREKIQSFVDSLKQTKDIADADLKKKNNELIAEGEKLVADIDAKMKKLDEIPADAATKTKEEFSKVVGEATTMKNATENGFSKMIKDMNDMLGIKKK